MPISLKCSCGQTLRAKDDLVGKKAKCPACGVIHNIPKPEYEVVEEEEVFDAEPVEPEERITPRRSRTREDASFPAPAPRRTEHVPERRPRKRKRRRIQREEEDSGVVLARGWFGNINAGVVGGVLMILVALVWFVVGLAGGIIFFYPPILAVIGFAAIIKGAMSSGD
jgi:hypothetical protein